MTAIFDAFKEVLIALLDYFKGVVLDTFCEETGYDPESGTIIITT